MDMNLKHIASKLSYYYVSQIPSNEASTDSNISNGSWREDGSIFHLLILSRLLNCLRLYSSLDSHRSRECKCSDSNMVKRLLNDGMDVNAIAWGPKSKGLTALHLAAEGGHLEVMDELLERGANIDARTKGACGWTPLHTAAKERRKEAVKFLVENGAFLPDDINDCRFNPPLHYCPGLEWAYEEMKRLHHDNCSSGETSCSSES
ncbi:ankyrin-3-like isoform X1 [Cucumis melo var. makuwa]|uniref:Ankyrin-3-like isoform X1 n=1 Tax=Cucumis melo var. makuwa TaxID=1194695 RepID=A0A5D3CX85_CUCMM|nr:ankyrin-3-like isoform X1 [Cucumis melo var. makuwa]